MTRSILLLSLALVMGLMACKQEVSVKGSEYLTQESLVEVLVDIHMADGITNDRKFYRRYEDVDSVDLLGPILEKHEVSRQMFDTTMHAYTRHPELLDQVYNEVLMKLNMMLDELDEEKKEETPEDEAAGDEAAGDAS